MNTLNRRRSQLRTSSTLVSKLFVTVIANAEPEAANKEEGAWIGASSTRISNLHALLQSCVGSRSAIGARACHAKVLRMGFEDDTSTSNVLINAYSKCGLLWVARKLFDEMIDRNLVSWNSMIASCTRNRDYEEALDFFVRMQREGEKSNEFTISSVLCACGSKGSVLEGRQLHGFAVKAGIDSNVYVVTALLDVYSKCGGISDASKIFERTSEKSEVTWSSMISGYVRNQLYQEALLLFRRAQTIGLEQNQYTLSSIISACASLAALIEGTQIHAILYKAGFVSNVYVVSSLVDMYAKCGSVREAYLVFSDAKNMNIVLWNAMISGFAKHAHSIEAMILFEKMQQDTTRPNEVTYSSLLSACGHMGLVGAGRRYFELMKSEHGLTPNVLHYSCMVDILGRAGLISEAHGLIESMPFESTASMWGSLLASCRVYGHLELAELAAKKLFEMEPDNAGNHVLMSNIYAANKSWDEVARARKLLKESDIKKVRGKSWIQIGKDVHKFTVGDRSHPRIIEVYAKLRSFMKDAKRVGYETGTAHELHDIEEGRKQELLTEHSEKLAFAFGLMCLPRNAPMRIMKNLRICGDCHSFMKFASSVVGREIVVRDVNRFHHFRGGRCSCGEFW